MCDNMIEYGFDMIQLLYLIILAVHMRDLRAGLDACLTAISGAIQFYLTSVSQARTQPLNE